MAQENQHVADVKEAINSLIRAGTSYDVDALDALYHDTLDVVMIDAAGNVTQADKNGFKALFRQKRDNGDPPLNTWAEFNLITANAQNGHVLITRKVKLMEEEQKLTLSIDLIRENGRWQIVREVIFTWSSE